MLKYPFKVNITYFQVQQDFGQEVSLSSGILKMLTYMHSRHLHWRSSTVLVVEGVQEKEAEDSVMLLFLKI